MTHNESKGAIECSKCSTPIEELYRDQLVTAWVRDTMVLLDDGQISYRSGERREIKLGQFRQVHEVHWVCRVCGHRFDDNEIDQAVMERKL